jgi:general secretion pathway protein C
MKARLLAFAIWALVAATAVFWGLRLFVKVPAAPPGTQPLGGDVAPRADLSRLLGAEPVIVERELPVAQAASRFKLLGVAAPKTANQSQGVALIAIDGKPARAFRVGASVDSEVVLQSVHARGASLGARGGPAQVQLELPALPPPATGNLAGAMAQPLFQSDLPQPGLVQVPPQPMPPGLRTMPPTDPVSVQPMQQPGTETQ